MNTKIAQYRKLRGLTQVELADKAGLNVTTVNRMESPEADPQLSTLTKIAEALDVSVEILIEPTRPVAPVTYQTVSEKILARFFELLRDFAPDIKDDDEKKRRFDHFFAVVKGDRDDLRTLRESMWMDRKIFGGENGKPLSQG